jgi:8-hydroxy-5-deazaflavin:NADPH oxidoreductase
MGKKIGILGSGAVGKSLAAGFTKHGYAVMIGSDTVAKRDELSRVLENATRVGTFAEAAAFGDVLVLAVKGGVAEKILGAVPAQSLSGKIVIDTTNPIADQPPTNGVLHYFTAYTESLMERLQKKFSQAKFVKAFSSVGAGLMVNPDFKGVKPTMFICGNDDVSKSEVNTILERFGWEPEDMGSAEAARAIEPLAILWCIPGFRENRWTHAFKLLKQ